MLDRSVEIQRRKLIVQFAHAVPRGFYVQRQFFVKIIGGKLSRTIKLPFIVQKK